MQIYGQKLWFNREVLHLRDIKRNVISEVNEAIVALEKVQNKLPEGLRKELPKVEKLSLEEEPEK